MTSVRPRPGLLNIRSPMVAVAVNQGGPATINIFNNENGLGPSAKAVAAAVAALDRAELYPESGPEQLAEAIAGRFDLEAARIACGHGSDDLLARLARAYLAPGDQLIHSANGYQKIPNYAYANDAEPIAAADTGFKADVDAILSCVSDKTRMVMIANPDNPSGLHLAASEIRRLHAGLPGHVLLVLDSAYCEYVDAADYENPTALVEQADNVVVTRTFSKIFALAGLRVGWLFGPAEVVDAVKRIGTTFPLTSPSLAAAIAALADTQHTRSVRESNRLLRRRVTEELSASGLYVYPSQTNFVLVRFDDAARPALKAYDYLVEHGIIPRRFAAAAFQDCIRFTLGRDEEMRMATDAVKEFLSAAPEAS